MNELQSCDPLVAHSIFHGCTLVHPNCTVLLIVKGPVLGTQVWSPWQRTAKNWGGAQNAYSSWPAHPRLAPMT